MTKEEYAKKLVNENIKKYNLSIPTEKLPWSGVYLDVELNNGETELVDQMVEFTLCKMNSFYFIDRYGFTNHPSKGYVPFKLFNFQQDFLRKFQEEKKIIFKKSRQVGASVVSGAYALWRANFYKSQLIKIISLTKNDAVEFKEKTIDLNYEHMPGFMKSKTPSGKYSKMKIELSNGSTIQTLPKSKNAGRGGTPSLVIIDEAAFNEYMNDIWKSIGPSLDKGGDLIVISTTNGVGNWYHLTYTRAEQNLNNFYPIFIPWWYYPERSNPWRDEIMNKLENNEMSKEQVNKFVKQEENKQLSYEGSPKDAPWLWQQRANAKSEKEFNQEIMAEFLGSGDTVVPYKIILDHDANTEEPTWVDCLPNDELIPGLWCWDDVKEDSMYMMTADTATGHGGDYSTFHVVDVYSKEQVAEYKYQIPTDDFGVLIKRVARYYNEAYVIIECNHPGPAVFNEVFKDKEDPYYNGYIRQKSGKPWGWDTTAKSRTLLIEDFYKDVKNKNTKIKSTRLVDEIKTFIWSDTGKPEAMKGNNDDLIIAYAMYAHLLDFVYSSKPAPIHTKNKKVDYTPHDTNAVRWGDEDEFYQNHYKMDLDEYYWLQGWKVPEEYKKYKHSNDNEKINMKKPPQWVKDRIP